MNGEINVRKFWIQVCVSYLTIFTFLSILFAWSFWGLYTQELSMEVEQFLLNDFAALFDYVPDSSTKLQLVSASGDEPLSSSSTLAKAYDGFLASTNNDCYHSKNKGAWAQFYLSKMGLISSVAVLNRPEGNPNRLTGATIEGCLLQACQPCGEIAPGLQSGDWAVVDCQFIIDSVKITSSATNFLNFCEIEVFE